MLDPSWALDGLPFMPEMVPHCGRRFQVAYCAERTCVHPPRMPFRRLENCLVLEGLRCDGSSHGGCQLGCMILWKEDWLKEVEGPFPSPLQPQTGPNALPPVHRGSDTSVFFCQATELPEATQEGDPLWKPGQYVGFIRKGTLSAGHLLGLFLRMGLRKVTQFWHRHVRPLAPDPAAKHALGLVPGQWVQVRSRREILATLDRKGQEKGLAFTGDMSRFCGLNLKVQGRVDRIMDEATGRLRTVQETVILENTICDRYLGCARGMPYLWREAWLCKSSPFAARIKSTKKGSNSPTDSRSTEDELEVACPLAVRPQPPRVR